MSTHLPMDPGLFLGCCEYSCTSICSALLSVLGSWCPEGGPRCPVLIPRSILRGSSVLFPAAAAPIRSHQWCAGAGAPVPLRARRHLPFSGCPSGRPRRPRPRALRCPVIAPPHPPTAASGKCGPGLLRAPGRQWSWGRGHEGWGDGRRTPGSFGAMRMSLASPR